MNQQKIQLNFFCVNEGRNNKLYTLKMQLLKNEVDILNLEP